MEERGASQARLVSWKDLEWGGALFGGVSGALALGGVDGVRSLCAGGLVTAFALFFVLLRRVFQQGQRVKFSWDGGVKGRGYMESFRRAERSLLLMHVDDDAPGPELLGLYADLLERGVIIRRILFLRPGHLPEGHEWMRELPVHPGLRQRVVRAERGAMMLSFAIVDEAEVLLAVPGYRLAESAEIAGKAVLRHLIRLSDTSATRAFLQTYESAWQAAESLEAE